MDAFEAWLVHLFDLAPAEPGQRLPPLDYVCFMFWDIAPIADSREDTVREVIKVLEAILALDSAACQRAALHGLGHWHHKAPVEAAGIVRRWLAEHPQAPDELRAYAVNASSGHVP